MNKQERKRKRVWEFSEHETILPGDVCDLDTLTEMCGYFHHDAEVNNGYGCTHIDNEYIGEDDRDLCMGKCYPCACPIASNLVYDYDENGGEDSGDAATILKIIEELGAQKEDFRESDDMMEIHTWPPRSTLDEPECAFERIKQIEAEIRSLNSELALLREREESEAQA